MTAVDLDALDAARAAATPGPWRYDEAVGVRNIPSADAALIVTAVNALEPLIAEARRYRALREAVEGLAEEMAEASQLRPTHGEFDRGVAAHQGDAADRLRAALAAVDGGAT